MSDWPSDGPIQAVLSIASDFSFAEQARGFNANVPASAVWPTANLGIFVPFIVPVAFVVRSLFCLNGTAAAGNIDLGVYGIDGSLVVSKGSTAMSGTSTLQILTVTETLLSAGRYYLAMSCSSTTAQFTRVNPAILGQQIAGVVQAASQLPLANLPTFASPANAFLPWFGMASITTY